MTEYHKQIGVYTPNDMMKFIDKERGVVSRSRYILNLLYKYKEGVEEMDNEKRNRMISESPAACKTSELSGDSELSEVKIHGQ